MSRREGQCGEQGDNQNMMPMTMLMQLQKEFEILKKNNEEELSKLRAKNAHKKRKLHEEIVLNSSFEIVQPRMQTNERVHNDESFQTTRKRLPETFRTFSGMSSRKHLLFMLL